MSSAIRRSAAVHVQPRLLADALRRMLRLRGLEVAPPGATWPSVDLMVTDSPEFVGDGRVVVTLPGDVGKGGVRVEGHEVDLPIDGLADLDVVLARFLR